MTPNTTSITTSQKNQFQSISGFHVGTHYNFQVINKNYYPKKKGNSLLENNYVHIISPNNRIETFATFQINKHKPFWGHNSSKIIFILLQFHIIFQSSFARLISQFKSTKLTWHGSAFLWVSRHLKSTSPISHKSTTLTSEYNMTTLISSKEYIHTPTVEIYYVGIQFLFFGCLLLLRLRYLKCFAVLLCVRLRNSSHKQLLCQSETSEECKTI